MQSKEDDPKPQSGSSSLFFLPNFQKIVVKVDLSIQILNNAYRSGPKWKLEHPQEESKPSRNGIVRHLSRRG